MTVIYRFPILPVRFSASLRAISSKMVTSLLPLAFCAQTAILSVGGGNPAAISSGPNPPKLTLGPTLGNRSPRSSRKTGFSVQGLVRFSRMCIVVESYASRINRCGRPPSQPARHSTSKVSALLLLAVRSVQFVGGLGLAKNKESVRTTT